jgi:predicted DNA-binding transcriptional regulator YafY
MFRSNTGLQGHLVKLIELINSNERLHYVDVAVKLNVSPQTAQRYLLMLSRMYPDHLEYSRGTIYRKSLLGVDNVPLEHKVEMLRSRLDTFEDKLRTVKQALTSLIERENCSIDEVKAELKKILEMIQ